MLVKPWVGPSIRYIIVPTMVITTSTVPRKTVTLYPLERSAVASTLASPR